jgi:hypothetical protein
MQQHQQKQQEQEQEQDILEEEEKQYLDRKVILLYNYGGCYSNTDICSIGYFNRLTFREFINCYTKQNKYKFKWVIPEGEEEDYVIVCWKTYYRSHDPFKDGSVFDIFDDMTGKTGYISKGHHIISSLPDF